MRGGWMGGAWAQRWRFIPTLALIAVACVAYHDSFRVPELLDDRTAISGNASIRELSDSLHPPARAGTGGRPFANFTFALNYAWTETDLWSYHLVNLAIHIAAGLTVYGIVRRTLALLSPARETVADVVAARVALAAAGLWVAHPVTTIAVTYISQRTESLMGLLYLQTLYAFIRASTGGSVGWWAWSITACFLGMATKEVMVTAPIAVLLYDRGFVARTFPDALRRHGRFYAALGASWLLLALLLQTDLKQRLVGFGVGVDASHYALTETHAVMLYLLRAVWPANLVFDYGTVFLTTREAWPWLILAGGLCGVVAVGLWRRPAMGFWCAWFVLVLLPTSTVVPIAGQPIAENRVYVPLAGLTILFAVTVYRFVGRHAMLVLAAVGVALTWMSERRNQTYTSPLHLWTDTIAKQPDNARAYDNRGEILAAEGGIAAAIADFQHALELNPNSTQTHSLLGNAQLGSGHPRDALEHYRRAIELAPQVGSNYQNLGAALAALGENDAAMANYLEALRLDPTLGIAHRNAGLLHFKLGRLAEAEAQLRQAVALDEDDRQARYALAVVLMQGGRIGEAMEQLAALLQERPEDAQARNALGVAYLRQQRWDDAQREFEHVLRLEPAHRDALGNLARLKQLSRGDRSSRDPR